MFRRDVVSCGSACGGLAELRERLGVVAVGEVEQARRAVGHGAVRARVERLLGEERGRLLLALREVRERQLGERRRVGGLAHEHLARLGDGLVDLPALAQRRDVERARVDGVRVVLHEVREPVGGLLLLAATAAHLGQRDGHVLRVRRELRGERELSSAPARSPSLPRTTPEVVARLPQVRVERDGLAQQRRRAIPLPVLRGLHPLHHLAHGLRVRRRQRERRGSLRRAALPPPHAAERENEQEDGRREEQRIVFTSSRPSRSSCSVSLGLTSSRGARGRRGDRAVRGVDEGGHRQRAPASGPRSRSP